MALDPNQPERLDEELDIDDGNIIPFEAQAERYPQGGNPGTFDQPHPKGIPAPKKGETYTSSQYPFNHVFETESGHITEFDDSPFGIGAA